MIERRQRLARLVGDVGWLLMGTSALSLLVLALREGLIPDRDSAHLFVVITAIAGLVMIVGSLAALIRGGRNND